VLPPSPLPFSALISDWFRLRTRLSDVITLLCGPYYAPFIYGQHRYASTFQSAEALACATLPTRQKTRSEHAARVNAVTAALQDAQLDAETITWAENIIRGRNDKPLRQLIEELISSTGEMGHQLLAAAPDLPGSVAAARTSVSHPGPTGQGTLTRYWLGEALVRVARARILTELGATTWSAGCPDAAGDCGDSLTSEASFRAPTPASPRVGLAWAGGWRRAGPAGGLSCRRDPPRRVCYPVAVPISRRVVTIAPPAASAAA
jgi:hypothetical protein